MNSAPRGHKPDADQLSEIYIDESSQTKHRYLGLGGIIVHVQSRQLFENALSSARHPELPSGELKWTKVSTSKLPAYRRVVDLFFDGVDSVQPLHFHSVIIDTHQLNDAAHNDGSREIGFNKEVYQLARKFGIIYPDRLFHVYPDYRTTPATADDLRLILNRGIAKTGDKRDWPYRRLHFRHSHSTPILQLVDVLLGAFMFQRNDHRSAANASPAKCELSDYIMRRAGIRYVDRDTSRRGKYTVWHRRLR